MPHVTTPAAVHAEGVKISKQGLPLSLIVDVGVTRARADELVGAGDATRFEANVPSELVIGGRYQAQDGNVYEWGNVVKVGVHLTPAEAYALLRARCAWEKPEPGPAFGAHAVEHVPTACR